jgi:hypothetical protein
MTTELKAAIAVSSPWEQATLWVNHKQVAWGAELVLLRGQENIVTVEAPPAIARELNLGLPADGDLNIVASPNFGNWVAPVNGKFNWAITPDAGKSGLITLVFISREVVLPWVHGSRVISSNLADEVTPLLNGKVIPDTGAMFVGGEEQRLTLGYKGGGVLVGAPLRLNWVPKSGLELDDVYSEPLRNQETTDHSWGIVCAREKSGVFDLKLSIGDEQGVLAMPGNRLVPLPVNFRFIRDSSTEHPLPPALVTVYTNTLFLCVVRLVTWEGSPLVGKAVTFYRPEFSNLTAETDAKGFASAPLAYTTAGVREISAEVLLEQGVKHSVKVLVNVKRWLE